MGGKSLPVMSFAGSFFRGGSAAWYSAPATRYRQSWRCGLWGGISASYWLDKTGSSCSDFRTDFVRRETRDLYFFATTLSSRSTPRKSWGKPALLWPTRLPRLKMCPSPLFASETSVSGSPAWHGKPRPETCRTRAYPEPSSTGPRPDHGQWGMDEAGVWGPLMALDDARDHLVLFSFHPSAPVRDQLAQGTPSLRRALSADFGV